MLSREKLLNKEIILSRKAYFAIGYGESCGVNATLEVFIKGQLDPKTELCMNLIDVDKLLKSFLSQVDHKNIDLDLRKQMDPGNKYKNTEGPDFLVSMAWDFLQKKMNSKYCQLYRIKLYFGEDFQLSLGF